MKRDRQKRPTQETYKRDLRKRQIGIYADIFSEDMVSASDDKYVDKDQSDSKETYESDHCNTLQHTATHCNTLQHTAPHFPYLTTKRPRKVTTTTNRNIRYHTAQYNTTLQHTATHYNTPQHTIPHCTIQHHTATHYNTPQHTIPHYNIPHHTATHFPYLTTKKSNRTYITRETYRRDRLEKRPTYMERDQQKTQPKETEKRDLQKR